MSPLFLPPQRTNSYSGLVRRGWSALRGLVALGVIAVALVQYSPLSAMATEAVFAPTTSAAAIKDFDCERFVGLWYKIAKVQDPKEAPRTRDRMEFMLRYDGTISLINTYYSPQRNVWERRHEALEPVHRKGTNSSHKESTASFRIQRFGPFHTGFHIMAIDPQYQWAMVADSTPNSFFILARSANVSAATRVQLEKQAASLGIAANKLTWLETDNGATPSTTSSETPFSSP